MNTHVYILTRCRRLDRFFATALVFKTLRTGFPTFPIHVVDNASEHEVRGEIRNLAQSTSATFLQLNQEIPHYRYLAAALWQQESGSAVFIDSDICFWESLESWRFDTVMAGRFIPQHHCPFSKCVTHWRLHTSLLWISDVAALRQTIRVLREQHFEFDPFRSTMYCIDGEWRRFDTNAHLCNAIPEHLYAFSERELACYDHLFCGSHEATVAESLNPGHARAFADLFSATAVDHRALRGAWRLQDEYFWSRTNHGAPSATVSSNC